MIIGESMGECDESDRKYEKGDESDERRLSSSESELRVWEKYDESDRKYAKAIENDERHLSVSEGKLKGTTQE